MKRAEKSELDWLIDEIKAEFLYTAGQTGIRHFSAEVEKALRSVDRSLFVPDGLRADAWANAPLPIGHGQTISQPFIVALMTELLRVKPGDRILEVGTGSGYQSAILASLGAQVFSVEIVDRLAETARQRLLKEGFDIQQRRMDGHLGWPEEAPFDGIIVTAASAQIPSPLVDQLKRGGRMVIPLGEPRRHQWLILVSKDFHGEVTEKPLIGVAFVPLVKAVG